jgi:hypothetical protein
MNQKKSHREKRTHPPIEPETRTLRVMFPGARLPADLVTGPANL